ncbi:MAG: deoxyribonuclease IV [Ignavibacteria bacterium]|nr:deoxyribonuclease IV [Ignavibacteria bacterium]
MTPLPILTTLGHPLGAHMSVNGGLHTAFARGSSIGCTTMQIFVKNANQWKGRSLSDTDVQNYKSAAADATISPVVAHAAYLINLCTTSGTILKKSRAAFLDELSRCEALGILGVIFHPGAHLGKGESEGIKLIAESLNLIHERSPGYRCLSVLETTAGQGTTVGYRFEQLRAIIDLVEQHDRMAVCLDTCHVFAAGYDFRTENGWNEMMEQFDSIIGLKRLAAIHMNDSKREHGSRIDRHEHIGKGHIGEHGFRFLMNDSRLHSIPKILETEKGDDMSEDVENMRVLLSLVKGADSQ